MSTHTGNVEHVEASVLEEVARLEAANFKGGFLKVEGRQLPPAAQVNKTPRM
jgi:hypothetical protein